MFERKGAKMRQIQISDQKNADKTKDIFMNAFNAKLPKRVERSLSLPATYTSNAPRINLGEATECFIHGFFNASISLSRTTLEQALKHKLNIDEKEIVSMNCLIKLATAQKLLNNNLEKEAIKIQKWGNIYIHDKKKKDIENYEQESRSKEVLLSVKKIIETLYPHEGD